MENIENLTHYLNRSSRSVFYLSELSTGKFYFINNSTANLFGCFPFQFYQNGYNHFYSLIHEDDYPSIIKSHISIKIFANDLKDGESKVFVSEKEFRIKNKQKDEWITVKNIELVNIYKAEKPKIKITGILKKATKKQKRISKKEISDLSDVLFSNSFPNGLAKFTSSSNFLNIESNSSSPALIQLLDDSINSVKISTREKEVLCAIASGLSTKEMAVKFHISESTIITHRKHLLEKFDSKNTAELIKKASKLFWFE